MSQKIWMHIQIMIIRISLSTPFFCGDIWHCNFVDLTSMNHCHYFSLLSLWYYVSVLNLVIYYGIDSTFTTTSFSTNIRAYMICFLGTNLAYIIYTSCWKSHVCSTLIWLIPRDLHTFWILIGMQHPYDIFTSTNYIPKVPLKILMWTLCCNQKYWMIERLWLVAKHHLWSNFVKSLQNGFIVTPTSPIHWVGQWRIEVVHDQRTQIFYCLTFPLRYRVRKSICYVCPIGPDAISISFNYPPLSGIRV